jgi:hypothetical protein
MNTTLTFGKAHMGRLLICLFILVVSGGMLLFAPDVKAVNTSINSGVTWYDNNGDPVNAHGGGIWYENGIYYLYGEYFSGGTNNFKAFAMYSSTDLMNWTFERKILPVQASGELGPNRVGERPHILKCPSTGEYVLYAHAADLTYQADKECVYATCSTINGNYTYRGILTNSSGQQINHSDMTAYQDGSTGYVCTESGYAFKLATDYHSWTTITLNGSSALSNKESPTIFKMNSTYYWLWSNKTGWSTNDNSYATAAGIAGPWTNQGLLVPSGQNTWNSQCTFVLPVTGTQGTTYMYWGDRWNAADNSKATYVWQPLIVNGSVISMPTFYASWVLDVTTGTWHSAGGSTPTPAATPTPTPVTTATPTPTGTSNLALNKTSSADSSQTGHEPVYGNDGSTSTRWCAANGNTGHWWKVDLGANKNITSTEVMWEKSGQIYKYKVEVSTDDTTWTLKVDKTNNTSTAQTQTDPFTATARYVRITVTGLPASTWASFFEFRVYGN